ncbi:MAG: WavE lipopolysaccharide synthesis family protein [Chlamydiales bacterium]|nr:WavE lipopolysaccharide synthesis family protein [Chlamydiales bacterium]
MIAASPVPFSDITFVVQGPIHRVPRDQWGRTTQECLESLRKHFPGSQIILSSYKDSDVSGLSYDQVILSADPGSLDWVDDSNPGQVFHPNINRMIVTSLAGLREVKTPYACKIRSDLVFTSSALAQRYTGLQSDPKLTFLQERIQILDFYTRNEGTNSDFSFCISDLLFFGLTADLLCLFDIPLATPEVINSYFNESYLAVYFLRKYHPVPYTHFKECGPEVQKLYAEFLANQFIIVNAADVGLPLPFRITQWDRASIYTHQDWQALYRIHCLKQWVWKPLLAIKTLYNRLVMYPYDLRKKLRIRTRLRALLAKKA